ncbi:MAG: glycosyltransferase [Flavobacteriales bacterium]
MWIEGVPGHWILGVGCIAMVAYARLIWHWGRDWKPAKTLSGQANPEQDFRLGLLVACRNEAQRIQPLLEGLSRQDSLKIRDIWFVDDHSEDDTLKVIRQWAALQKPRGLSVVAMSAGESTGKKAALLTGMQAMPESITHVLLTDADARVDAHWMAGWHQILRQHPETALFIGEVQIESGGSWRGAVERLEFSVMMAWAASTIHRGQPANASGANLLVRRDIWASANLMADVASGDDVFLAQHLAQIGQTVRWNHALETRVKVDPTPNGFDLIQQRARWGRKSNRYPNRAAQYTALVIVTMNLWMILGVASLSMAWPILVLKVACDGWLTRRIMQTRWRALDWLVFSLLYPILVLSSVVLAWGFPRQIHWKNRPLNPARER